MLSRVSGRGIPTASLGVAQAEVSWLGPPEGAEDFLSIAAKLCLRWLLIYVVLRKEPKNEGSKMNVGMAIPMFRLGKWDLGDLSGKLEIFGEPRIPVHGSFG